MPFDFSVQTNNLRWMCATLKPDVRATRLSWLPPFYMVLQTDCAFFCPLQYQ